MISKKEYKDEGILIRPLKASDADNFYDAVKESVSQLSQWFQWCHTGYSREEATKFIDSCLVAWTTGHQYDFSIEDISIRRFIGVIGLNRIDKKNGSANIGYWIRRGATGNGYATAALKLVAKWGFTELNLNRVEALCAIGNLSSIRVAEKAGFLREGVLRGRFMLKGSPHDAVLLAMLREEVG